MPKTLDDVLSLAGKILPDLGLSGAGVGIPEETTTIGYTVDLPITMVSIPR